MRRFGRASIHGATACHVKVVRGATGEVEWRRCFGRPRPWWNLTAWLWLAERYIEYRLTERAERHAGN